MNSSLAALRNVTVPRALSECLIMQTKKASTKASPKNIRVHFINLLTVAATFPELFLLLALFIMAVIYGY